jgi:hypothetical protein
MMPARARSLPLVVTPQSRADHREILRRRVVTLIFVVYWLMVFEGALRKWAFPEFQQYLYFLRDPIVLVIYVVAIGAGLVAVDLFLALLLVVGVLGVLQSAAALLLGGSSLVVLPLGLRSYYLYLPLAWIVAACFRRVDLARFVRQNLMVALGIAPLVLLQFRSPAEAWINRGTSEDHQIALVALDIVRPYGTFSYTAGHSLWVGSLVALVAVAWLRRTSLRIPGWLLLAGGAAVLVMTLTTGNRSTFFQEALIALAVLAIPVVGGRASGRLQAPLVLLLFIGVAALLYGTVLATAYEAMLARQADVIEHQNEDTLGRAISPFYDFLLVLPETPALGHGMGAGTLGAAFLTTGAAQFLLAEGEPQRIILELGPVLGLLFILLRWAFAVKLAVGAIGACRRGDPTAMILMGFAAIQLLIGQITGNVTLGCLVWLCVGLIMASSRRAWIDDAKPQSDAAPTSRGRWRASTPGRVPRQRRPSHATTPSS